VRPRYNLLHLVALVCLIWVNSIDYSWIVWNHLTLKPTSFSNHNEILYSLIIAIIRQTSCCIVRLANYQLICATSTGDILVGFSVNGIYFQCRNHYHFLMLSSSISYRLIICDTQALLWATSSWGTSQYLSLLLDLLVRLLSWTCDRLYIIFLRVIRQIWMLRGAIRILLRKELIYWGI